MKEPSSAGTTAIPFVSIGAGATRWFTNRPRTTTSAPSSGSSSDVDSKEWATLVPNAGHSSGASSATAASTSTTTGNSSYSTATSSAASTACSRVSATTTATISPTNRTTSRAKGSRLNNPSTSACVSPSTVPDGGRGERPRSVAT